MLLLLAGQSLAQNNPTGFQAWKLTSYSGYVGIRGFYREQERVLNNVIDYSQFPFVYGGIGLNTRSFIGHPNLLLLDIGGEYNPGVSQQTYTVSPDRSEVLTATRLDIRATLFNEKPMSLGGYLNLNQNFINREYVTSLKTDTKQWGLFYVFRNKILPLTVNYNDRKWDQIETETNRTFRNKQSDLQAAVRKSFTKYGDTHELRFTRYNYFREDQNLVTTSNIYDNLILNNTIFFDKGKKYMFNSSITNLNQKGNLSQKRFQMFERVSLRLPYKLMFSGSYNYASVQQETQSYKQQNISTSLDHQLFTSLRTGVFYDYTSTTHTAYNETNTRIGINFNYIKKIPTGTLNLNYSIRRHNQQVDSNPGSNVQIIDEEHLLSDALVVLLDRPYINLLTVVVKDITSSIIYQKDIDYQLFERDSFIELVRIPGGQIVNDSPVLVDYIAAQVGNYNFNADLESFSARVTLFQRLLELYYTISNQDYSNVESDDLLTLNYFTRNVYGARINWKLLTGGIERDDYRSTIVPYQKLRYFLQMNGMIGKKMLLSLNGEYSNINLTTTDTDQMYSSIYGKIIYQFKPQTKLNLDLGYRKQIGEEINLDLVTARTEFNTVYRNLYLKVGLEVYKRNYVGEQLNFKGVYFQIDRKF